MFEDINQLSVKPEVGNSTKPLLPAVPSSEVYLMDCIDGMKHYPDKYFDLACIDPPYGIGHSLLSGEKRGSKFVRTERHVDWDVLPTDDFWIELFRVSKNQIIWGGNYFLDNLPPTRGMIIWDKIQMFSGADFEFAWTSFDNSAKAFRMSRVEAYGNIDKIHPTQKPISLYDFCFQFAKVEVGANILDTHLGSGSSRISAYKGGFNFVGFEIDQEYYEKQEKRFNDFKSQLRLF
ncbi:MAG: site-specific DNA-methyltransferase [Bacteroidetes bacterium]|nr:site-specific DNA-methyltransferase [Bacteroidota bacterium]